MTNDMTRGNPVRLILAFMIPTYLGNIFQQFYNLVDSVVAGRYIGVNALAASGRTTSRLCGNVGVSVRGLCGGHDCGTYDF